MHVTKTLWIALVAMTLATPAFAGHHAKKKDVVDTAASAGTFQTLIAAAKAAGLVDALRSDGPLTVFAPTDDAFSALPAGTIESVQFELHNTEEAFVEVDSILVERNAGKS